ncbi:hypothetical protein V7S43_015563 [Phytophthora oleae]|uniref:RWP-RK domain-containing protein n=1 Tax=Phytophthora oleae TaxID=2107226 RepID=A0ABD3EYG2_9STRA
MSSPSSSSLWNSLQGSPWGIQTTLSHTGSNSDSDQEVAEVSNASNKTADQKQTVASDSEAEDSTSGKRKRKRIHFNVEHLQTVYHLPLKTVSAAESCTDWQKNHSSYVTAAERLGVCEAALKRICRRNHVHKWPYRQLTSVRRRIAELKDRYAVLISGDEGGGGTAVLILEDAHSVLGLTDALPVVRGEIFDRRGGQSDSVSVTPAQFHDKLRRLEEEKDQIILSAHQRKRPSESIQPPQLMKTDILMPHLQDRQSHLLPLDLNRIDRDFPLLFLANVCESVRAYN